MAATNSTPNLELSQFIGSDKPDWLTDYNGDMGKIDSSYGAVSAIAEEAAANAESAAASAAQATTDAAAAVSAVAGAVEAAQAAEAAAEQATTTATSALQIANGAATTAQGAAGDATTALSIAQNAKETAESAQAAAAAAAESAEEAAEAAQAAAGPIIGEALGAYYASDGTTTYSQVLNGLFALIDVTKLRRSSYIVEVTAAEIAAGTRLNNNKPRYFITRTGSGVLYGFAPNYEDPARSYRGATMYLQLNANRSDRVGTRIDTNSNVIEFAPTPGDATAMSSGTGFAIVY